MRLRGAAADGPPPVRPSPLAAADHTGFVSIFDGLAEEMGRRSGVLAAGQRLVDRRELARQSSQAEHVLIWRGGEPRDFELKVEYRISSTNSGIQIRSVQLPAGPDIGKWVMKGYQADIDAENQFTGQIYEERGRGFLAMRGQATCVPNGGRPRIIGNLQQTPTS